MSSQLFFRDKGKIWMYTEVTKGADSNPLSMGLLILEANREIRYKRLENIDDVLILSLYCTWRVPCTDSVAKGTYSNPYRTKSV